MDQAQALLDALGEWEGFETTDVERRAGDPDGIHVSLKPRKGAMVEFNCCDQACEGVYEHNQGIVRDLPLFDVITHREVTI